MQHQDMQHVVFDFEGRGGPIQRTSMPVMLGMAVFLCVLGLSAFFIGKKTVDHYLGGVFLVGMALWFGMTWHLFRKYSHIFSTRYVLTHDGIEVSSLGMETRRISWEQFSIGYRSRSLRFMRLVSPLVTPDIVLAFGAKGQEGITPNMQYAQAREFVENKLGDKLKLRWLL